MTHCDANKDGRNTVRDAGSCGPGSRNQTAWQLICGFAYESPRKHRLPALQGCPASKHFNYSKQSAAGRRGPPGDRQGQGRGAWEGRVDGGEMGVQAGPLRPAQQTGRFIPFLGSHQVQDPVVRPQEWLGPQTFPSEGQFVLWSLWARPSVGHGLLLSARTPLCGWTTGLQAATGS